MSDSEHIVKLKNCDIHFLNEHLMLLTERERKIIEFRFGLNGHEINTLKKIGELIGSIRDSSIPINRERVRQIEAKAISKLLHKKRHIKVIMHYNDFLRNSHE